VYQEPFYYSALVVLSTSKIDRFVDLKGKKIAYVDSKSTSGYLYPKAHLKKMNFQDSDFKQIIFSGNHSQSVQMLDDGKVDVIAVFSDDAKGMVGAWSKFGKLDKKRYKMLWISEPVPSDPFTVRQSFYDKYPNISHLVMVSIIDIFEKSENKDKYIDILGSKTLMPATSRQYDPVRDVIKNLNIQIN
jgi:phosphonate transport system substrate-binding protein